MGGGGYFSVDACIMEESFGLPMRSFIMLKPRRDQDSLSAVGKVADNKTGLLFKHWAVQISYNDCSADITSLRSFSQLSFCYS